MEHTMPHHPSRKQLQLYNKLSSMLDKVHDGSKTDEYMKKIKMGGKTAECFQHLGEIKRMEEEALKNLEKYLKNDAKKNATHNHNKELQHIDTILKNHKSGGWF